MLGCSSKDGSQMMRGNRKLYLKKKVARMTFKELSQLQSHFGEGMISELKNINFSEFNED